MTYERKRAYIPAEQTELIRLYAASPLYRRMKMADLAEKIRDEVHWPGKAPEIEVLVKKITEYRGPDYKADEDGLWSVGESAKPGYGIPADATGTMLELWRYSLEVGYPFTLRHAQWAARLHKVILTADAADARWGELQWLFFTALQYAEREWLSGAGRFDTSSEDTKLAIPSIEAATLQTCNVLPLPRLAEMPNRTGRKSKCPQNERLHGRAEDILYYSHIAHGTVNVAAVVHTLHRPVHLSESPSLRSSEAVDRFFRHCFRIEGTIAGLSIEQQRAYAILMTCLSRGPEWDYLSPAAFLGLIEALAQAVSEHNQLSEILESLWWDDKTSLASQIRTVGLSLPVIVDALSGLEGTPGGSREEDKDVLTAIDPRPRRTRRGDSKGGKK